LQSGVAGTATYTVTADMSPPHLPTKVLSTPSMVQLIEHLPADRATASR
jgi:hypothetical protein